MPRQPAPELARPVRKGGADGPREFWGWLAGHGLELPPGIPYASTPSGGRHLWLRVPPGRIVPSRNGVLPGVDVKGDNGYVVASPSGVAVRPLPRPGEPRQGPVFLPYAWHGCPCRAPDGPSALLDALDGLHGTGSANGAGTGGGHDGEVAAWVMSEVMRRLNRGEAPDAAMREAVYAGWVKIAVPQNPGWAYDRDDFIRHYEGSDGRGGALAKALALIAAEHELLVKSGGYAWAAGAHARAAALPAPRRERQPGQRPRRVPGRAS